jgi:hypothetical protein
MGLNQLLFLRAMTPYRPVLEQRAASVNINMLKIYRYFRVKLAPWLTFHPYNHETPNKVSKNQSF